jgi:glycosyltransferase involved in cell wall biosynthesis
MGLSVKKRVVHLNTVATGAAIPNLIRILQRHAQASGFSCELIFGRGESPREMPAYRVGQMHTQAWDLLMSRLFDSAGRHSGGAASRVLEMFRKDRPDLVHIHNLHGYWMNQKRLLAGLSELRIPVVWTLHDYWPITGHCAYFEAAHCERWRSGCGDCPQTRDYPRSYSDRSIQNYSEKKSLYSDQENLNLVTVSDHSRRLINQSILSRFPVTTIYNAVDTHLFRPVPAAVEQQGSTIVGCAARHWDRRKGLEDVIALRGLLDSTFGIMVVGLTRKQIQNLPSGILGIPATASQEEMAAMYSSMDVFFNPSREETFGLTTIEAMACGVPVVLYDVSANREVQPDIAECGIVDSGDYESAAKAIRALAKRRDGELEAELIKHVSTRFSRETFARRYYELYQEVISS